MEDYYKILGVDESADAEHIKSAYRKLAKQHHPDLNQGNAGAEETFKKINEAYDVLGDATRRTQYDQQRKFGFPGGFQGPQGNNPFGQEFHFNFGPGMGFDDIFAQFFGNHFGRQAPTRNKDFQFTLNLTLEDAFTGKSMPINFEANGQSRNMSVTIPAGVQSGSKLRFQGHGDRSVSNLPPGDLYVIVMINEHPVFRRDGPHLHMDLALDAISAMVGLQHTFKTIDGTQVNIDIPAGVQHGGTMRVAGQGMPVHNHARQRGDLYMNINVVVPRDLSPEHMAALKDINDQRRKTS